MTFRTRKFESLGQATSDVYHFFRDPRAVLEMVTGRAAVSPQLREKLMLAVTSVNRCRYCSFIHTRLALREGLSDQDVEKLLGGVIDHVDEDERHALLYAQHWADTGGHPDLSARRAVVEAYGEDRTRAIETAIRAIMLGNYFGNTFDAALSKASFGLAGGEH